MGGFACDQNCTRCGEHFTNSYGGGRVNGKFVCYRCINPPKTHAFWEGRRAAVASESNEERRRRIRQDTVRAIRFVKKETSLFTTANTMRNQS